MPVQKGDVLLISPNVDNSHRVTVKWQQMFSDKTANYYTIVAKNRSRGGSPSPHMFVGAFADCDSPDNAEVVLFVAAEWYEGSGPGQHISHIAPKDVDGMVYLLVEKQPLTNV